MINKLVEKCNENIDENEIIYNATLHNYGKVWISCTQYITLLLIVFVLIVMSISDVPFYFYLCVKRNYVNVVSYW